MSSLREQFINRLPRPIRRLSISRVLVDNRIQDFLEHSTKYAFCGQQKLAQNARISGTTISRMLTKASSPSYATIIRITEVLEKEFKTNIDPREVATINGKYPTASVCELLGCSGCTPERAWDENNTLLLP